MSFVFVELFNSDAYSLLERSLLLSACIVVRGRPENMCRVEDYSHIFCCIDADTNVAG